MRVSNVSSTVFSLNVVHKVKRAIGDDKACAFKPIPYSIDGPLQKQVGNFKVENVFCYSSVQEWQSIVTIVCSGFVICIVIFCILQALGVINVVSLFSGGDDRFDKLKQNPYAGQLDRKEKNDDTI